MVMLITRNVLSITYSAVLERLSLQQAPEFPNTKSNIAVNLVIYFLGNTQFIVYVAIDLLSNYLTWIESNIAPKKARPMFLLLKITSKDYMYVVKILSITYTDTKIDFRFKRHHLNYSFFDSLFSFFCLNTFKHNFLTSFLDSRLFILKMNLLGLRKQLSDNNIKLNELFFQLCVKVYGCKKMRF